MKTKEEIEKLADDYSELTLYKPKNAQELRDVNLIKIGFKNGYTQCQEDMADKIKKQIYDFTIDLKESTSTYVKQNCEGAIFGLNRLLNSLNKQD